MAPSDPRPNRRARHALVVIGALAIPSAAACNTIIGLDDYVEGECSGGRCTVIEQNEASTETSVPDAPREDVVTETGPGVSRVSWAKWIMPNDDASATSDNQLTYSVSGTEVTDRTTKLVWQNANTPSDAVDFEAARQICQSPWRLPSRIELVTLIDLSQPGTKMAPIFQAAQSAYWTSSEVRPLSKDAIRYWRVNFKTGHVEQASVSGDPAFVRCVKGASP